MASKWRSFPGWLAPVRAWEAEILAFHATGGGLQRPTEPVNLLIKQVKRVGHGFHNFPNYYRGCSCTAVSRGGLTEPQDCEDASHAWWRRAPSPGQMRPLGQSIRKCQTSQPECDVEH